MTSRIVGELNPPDRLLLGPGPANVSPRVLRALATPLLGHLDPAFLSIMDDTVYLLRQVFQTSNHVTIPISGTGSAGMAAWASAGVGRGDPVVMGRGW